MASDLARYLVLLGCTRTIRWYLAPFPMIHTQSADPTGGGSTAVWVLGLMPSGTVLAGADVIATLLGSDGALAAIAVTTVLILFGPPVAFAVLPAEGSLRWTSAVWVSWSPVWRYVCDSVLRNLRRPLLMIDQKPTIARTCSTSIYRRNMAEFVACFSSGPWAIADHNQAPPHGHHPDQLCDPPPVKGFGSKVSPIFFGSDLLHCQFTLVNSVLHPQFFECKMLDTSDAASVTYALGSWRVRQTCQFGLATNLLKDTLNHHSGRRPTGDSIVLSLSWAKCNYALFCTACIQQVFSKLDGVGRHGFPGFHTGCPVAVCVDVQLFRLLLCFKDPLFHRILYQVPNESLQPQLMQHCWLCHSRCDSSHCKLNRRAVQWQVQGSTCQPAKLFCFRVGQWFVQVSVTFSSLLGSRWVNTFCSSET